MFNIVIQAGGESRRMGKNKALLPFLGKPLIEHVLNRLKPAADEIFIISNDPASYDFLHIPIYPDIKPGRGALSGLHAALTIAKSPVVGVIACDMPFASPGLLLRQYHILLDEDADVVIPLTTFGLEPLHAVYRKETCLPVVNAVIESDNWKLTDWLKQVKVRVVTRDELATYDPDGVVFMNLNTPGEFQRAEDYAKMDRGRRTEER
jgi:molybdenum cofactor guanylyltransferase